MGQFYLGIDNGGSWIKVVIFDKKGKEISRKKAILPMEFPAPGLTVRNMEGLWQTNCQMIRSCILHAGIYPEEISGIGFSGHGKGLYLTDRNGDPCGRGIVSTDSRGKSVEDRWRKSGVEEMLLPIIRQPLVGCQPLCLVKWLQKHDPVLLGQARWIFGVKDYLRFRMTGRAAAEITDFSGSGFVNLITRQYDREILKITGLEEVEEKLPPLLWPSEPAGTVTKEAALLTGIPEGTICAAGVFDIDACALGMGLMDESKAAVIAGTWGINEYIAREPAVDRKGRKNSLYGIPGFYLVEESSPTSAGNLDLIMKMILQDDQSYSFVNEIAERVERGSGGLCFYPFLFGSDAQKGAFFGLSAEHTKAHMIRSVMEGVVFYHRLQLETLFSKEETSQSEIPEKILLGGGLCNSPLWVQMFADIINRPVILTECEETGAMGAAVTAALACGDMKSYGEAVNSMVHEKKTVWPEMESAAGYERFYQAYKATYRRIYQQI